MLLERGVASQSESQRLGARVADAVPREIETVQAAAGGERAAERGGTVIADAVVAEVELGQRAVVGTEAARDAYGPLTPG